MTLSQLLGGIGRTLISSGVIILMFVAFQLWGTGVQHARAQDSLANDFEQQLAAAAATAEAELASAQTEEPAPSDGAVDAIDGTTDAAEAVAAEPVEPPKPKIDPDLLYSDAGDPIARIIIDAIEVDQTVIEGVSVEDLRKGPGRYRTTSLPGQPGNASIAGHRTTYGAPFHRIDELTPGDEIQVQTLQGLFTYVVMGHDQPDGSIRGHHIVDPSATEVLNDFGDNRLTLTACHPKYSAAQRIIVTAELVGEPADFVPRPEDLAADPALKREWEASQIEATEPAADPNDNPVLAETTDAADPVNASVASVTTDGGPAADGSIVDETVAAPIGESVLDAASEASPISDDFGEGLNGDRAAIVPSVMWGLAAGAIWLAAWFLGTKWRRWPMYMVGLLPFAFAMWTTFDFVDKALPSY